MLFVSSNWPMPIAPTFQMQVRLASQDDAIDVIIHRMSDMLSVMLPTWFGDLRLARRCADTSVVVAAVGLMNCWLIESEEGEAAAPLGGSVRRPPWF